MIISSTSRAVPTLSFTRNRVQFSVQGTVIQSHYYSEDGHEPVGEVTVTKYSTDPDDFDTDTASSTKREKGITSVTTTQKFGYKGTPTLESVLDTKEVKFVRTR